MSLPSAGNPMIDVVVGGHRDHYGTARALDAVGYLRYMITDLYVGKGSGLSHFWPVIRALRKGLAGRLAARDSGLESGKIRANNIAGWRYWVDSRGARTVSARRAAQLALA